LDESGRGGDELADAIEQEHRRSLLRIASQRIRPSVDHDTWLAFWETTIAERSPAVVAEELGITVGAVYGARARVLKRLKAIASELAAETDFQHEERN
jgi:RNA polymerase sigma-70 factor (ECF subfamily)